MTFRCKDKSCIELVQWMVVIEQKIQIFCSLSEEETFHSIGLFAGAHILQSSPTTGRKATAFDVSKSHLADVEVPWILCSSIKVPR